MIKKLFMSLSEAAKMSDAYTNACQSKRYLFIYLGGINQ